MILVDSERGWPESTGMMGRRDAAFRNWQFGWVLCGGFMILEDFRSRSTQILQDHEGSARLGRIGSGPGWAARCGVVVLLRGPS